MLPQIVERQIRERGGARPRPGELRDLLVKHVYGMDEDACRVAELSLVLTMLDYIEPPDLRRTSTFKIPALHNVNIFHHDFFAEDCPLAAGRTAGSSTGWSETRRGPADRLLKLTRRMFHARRGLRRWEMTDDVFQNAMLRLHRALGEVKPESVRYFFNLAALMIRRELLDLAKHHFGPHGDAANHHTDGQPADDPGGSTHDHAETGEPDDLDQWSSFHTEVEKLPDEEREVVDLLFYKGLSQEEAAGVLGVSLRTVKRRWQSARCRLHEALNGQVIE